MRKPLAIVNPAAAGGRAGRRWPEFRAELVRALGDIDSVMTSASGDAKTMAERAVGEGRETVLSVGGDGTLHEVVNGLSGKDGPPPYLRLGIVNCGSGGDFCRTLGLVPGATSVAVAAERGTERSVDLGRILTQGADAPQWFVNIANAGFSGEVTEVIAGSRLPRMIGPKLAYLVAVASVMRRYRGRRVRLGLDGAPPLQLDISTLAIANGRYFGSGMLVAPMADPGDGVLDLIVFLSTPKIGLTDLRRVYDGSHLGHPAVRTFRARSIRLEPADGAAVLADADGERVGKLPVDIDCRPAALRLIA